MNPSSIESGASANGSRHSSPDCSECGDCAKRLSDLENALGDVLRLLNVVQNSLEERKKLEEQCSALFTAHSTTLAAELKQKVSRSELVDVNSRLNSLLSLYRTLAKPPKRPA